MPTTTTTTNLYLVTAGPVGDLYEARYARLTGDQALRAEALGMTLEEVADADL